MLFFVNYNMNNQKIREHLRQWHGHNDRSIDWRNLRIVVSLYRAVCKLTIYICVKSSAAIKPLSHLLNM